MCIFSRAVEEVSGTELFARGTGGGRQVLVYSMALAAADDLALILPLPVPPRAPEDSVRFVNLEDYPQFFDDLAKGFPEPPPAEPAPLLDPMVLAGRPLRVHEVGRFEASFVPTLADFGRLDPRFRLPEAAWEQLPLYRDWGFAVFKLKLQDQGRTWDALGYLGESTRGPLARALLVEELLRRAEGRRRSRFHPMASEFPLREPESLHFPTVHVHDGQVHARAHFDHRLYCQPSPGLVGEASPARQRVASEGPEWERSGRAAGDFMDQARSLDTINPKEPVYRLVLRGNLPNEDISLRPSGKGGRGDQ